MSEERSRLIEAREELEKAKKLRRRLESVKEWTQNIFLGALALAFLGAVGIILVLPWLSGAGYITIVLVSVGVSVGGWNFLNWKAKQQIDEAEKVQSRAMWRD